MTKTALLQGASKNSEFPQMQGARKFRRAAYVLYVSKKFFTQRSITSHLVAIFWRLSGMASSPISWDEMWIFRGSLLVILVLPLMITGCGNSDSQQESPPGKPGAADDTSKLCSSIEGTGLNGQGLAKQCSVNSRDSTVDAIIDSNDEEVARNICANIADKLTQLTAHFSVPWKLQIFSPYRSDKPMATCLLH